MISDEESRELMGDLFKLRNKYAESKSKIDKIKLDKHEAICIEKFKYLVTMKTGKYKQFANYEDLNQEGMEALVKSMKNYKVHLNTSFFWWAHKYIDTRISRSANLHTTIRYPLKVAKAITPHKESIMPLLIEERYCPDKELENTQNTNAVNAAIDKLNDEQKNIINLAFGFDGEKPMSINKLCKNLNISRATCIKTIDNALSNMKENIKI